VVIAFLRNCRVIGDCRITSAASRIADQQRVANIRAQHGTGCSIQSSGLALIPSVLTPINAKPDKTTAATTSAAADLRLPNLACSMAP
jgi:hypothetical protein